MGLDALNHLPPAAELAGMSQLERLPDSGTDPAVAAKQFEALLATMLVKEMRQTLSEGFFGDGPGSDSFNGWLDKSIGDSLADSWDLDLAGLVKTNLDAKQARLDEGAGEAQ